MRTVSEIFDRYEKERLPLLGTRTRADYTRHLRVLRERFGTTVAKDLTRRAITDFIKVPTGKTHQSNGWRALVHTF